METKKVRRRNKIRHGIRKKIHGTKDCPRLSVFRSNREIHAQLVDDDSGHTFVAASSKENDIASKKVTKTEKAKMVGLSIAKKALSAKIEMVYFDRGGYLYHGRVKALAEGAREGGLNF